MTSLYHVNPATGEAGVCRANKGKCRFSAPSDAHFTTRENAQAAFEAQMARNYLPSHMKKLLTVEQLEEVQAKAKASHELKSKETLQAEKASLAQERGKRKVASHLPKQARSRIKHAGASAYVEATVSWGANEKHYFGRLTPEKWLAPLDEADPTKRFQDGDCSFLALYLAARDPRVAKSGELRYLQRVQHPEHGELASIEGHAFAELHNGVILDSMGLWTKDEFARRFPLEGARVFYDASPIKADAYLEYNEAIDETRKLGALFTKMLDKHYEHLEIIVPKSEEWPLWQSLEAARTKKEKPEASSFLEKPKLKLWQRIFSRI